MAVENGGQTEGQTNEDHAQEQDFAAFETQVHGESREENDAEGAPTGQRNDDSTPAASGAGDAAVPGGDGDGATDPEPPKRSAQDRINLAARKQREAERRLAEAQAELDRLRAAPKTPPTETTADAAPDPSKYQYGELDAQYMRDNARYEARQEFSRLQAEQAKKEAAAKQQAEQNTVAQKVSGVVVKAQAKYDDFNDVLDDATAAGAQLTPTMVNLIAESDPEVAADVVYHLASNVEEALKFQRLSPMRQAAEFGKLEARFTKKDGAPAKKTAAPAPPQNRVRGAGGKFSPSGDTEDFAAFEALAMGRK